MGAADMRKWHPCLDGLKAEMEQVSPAAELRQRLGTALGEQAVVYESDQITIKEPATVAARHNCPSLLLADIQRIRLQECSNGKFCVEVATRVRLWDAHAGRYVFDQIALYTSRS